MRPPAPLSAPEIDYTAPVALAAGDEAVFCLPEFVFENGDRLRDLKVGYVTHGTLNADRDNAILLLPGTANTRHSADGYIGVGRALDPTRDFIIAVDAIGAGTSSKPSDGPGPDFPRYNIRDMVRARAHYLPSVRSSKAGYRASTSLPGTSGSRRAARRRRS